MAKPLELESRTTLFFVTASILALSAIWAVYEETYVRRPWKDYQIAFFELQAKRAKEKLEAAKKAFESEETQAKLKELEQKLEETRARIADPAVRAQYEEDLRLERKLQIRCDELKQEIAFAKSRLDASYSRYQEALHHGEDREAFLEQEEMARHEAEIARLQEEYEKAHGELKDVQARLDEYRGAVAKIEKEIEKLKKPVADAEQALAKVKAQSPELTQIWIPDLDVVDRCHNCHVGIDKMGYSDPMEVVAYAQALQEDGKELDAVTRRYGVDVATVEKWLEQAEAGETPDDGVPEVFRTHPHRWELLLQSHPAERFGCTPCHEGQGPQTKGIGSLLGGKEFDHGRNDHYWIRPMMKGDFVQSTCPDCHFGDTNLRFAEVLNQGQNLMQKVSCIGCHPIDGYPNDKKAGPTLTHVRAKTTPGWLEEWIKYPKAWREHTSMPNFWPEAVDPDRPKWERKEWAKKRDEEVRAITAYLWLNSEGAEGYLEPAPPPGDVARGREIVQKVGCYGCHAVEMKDPIVPHPGSETRAVGPKLARIGEKTNYQWLYNWVRDPGRLWHDTKMPSLRLTRQEAADVAAYLMTLTTGVEYETPALYNDPDALKAEAEKGRKLIGYYGCFGCHDIPGFENAQRIGADLSEFGRKMTSLLDFGNAITNPREQTWENWVELKLKDPRAYRTLRVETRMPKFDFTNEEVHALMVFLKSRRKESRPAAYDAMTDPRRQAIAEGEKLLTRYNCRGCHQIRGKGGLIQARYEHVPMAPPELFAVGAKTKPEWLYHFLQDPSSMTVRPWLEIRMPTFPWHEGEVTTLVRYFNALDDSKYPYIEPEPPADPELVAVGKQLFEQLRCSQCHMTSSVVPEDANLASLAPNLRTAHYKLRRSWIPKWLSDPNAWQKGSRMPAFWPGGFSPFPNVLGGDAQRQMEAVAAYVHQLGAPKPEVTERTGRRTAMRR